VTDVSRKFLKVLNSNGSTSSISVKGMPISDYTDYPIKILYLHGSIGGMTKDDKVTVNYIWGERSGTVSLKWQGSSSVGREKKNMTATFDEAFEVVSGWGIQKKYVLKANYVDSSHARNIVCAKTWGQTVKSRTPANDILNTLPNGGAIDGFPVVVALNGEFYGLYTWNIPKDDWMFGMSVTTQQQAIVCAELNNNGAVAFKGLATMEPDANGELDFDLEYSSDDQKDWVLTSLNRLIAAVKDSDGTNITYGITPYLDWESAIDYYIHAVLNANYDGIHRNYLLTTYDGVKWLFTGYDMDVVLGLRAMGKYFLPANTSMTFAEVANNHKLFWLIWKYMRPQLRARYNELRAAALSVENVANAFTDFISGIPLPVYIDDARLWNGIPSTSANNLSQIVTYYDLRCRNADEWIKNTSGETALPPQVDPNQFAVTNTLSNCTTSNAATTAVKGGSYTATITANNGYELDSVTVKMGGVDITSTAYSNGVVTISSVTGDIVITATTKVKAGYTNLMPTSKDTDGSVYGGTGVGWVGQVRISGSTGDVKTGQNYAAATGFMVAKAGDIIRMKYTGSSEIWDVQDKSAASNVIAYYKSDKTWLGSITAQPSRYGICTNNDAPTGTIADGGIVTAIVPNNADIGLFRISCASLNNSLDGLIITVNEEITD
jgi:hypothetical protein